METQAKGDWNLIEENLLLILHALLPHEQWEFRTWLFNYSIKQWGITGTRSLPALKLHWYRYLSGFALHPLDIKTFVKTIQPIPSQEVPNNAGVTDQDR